MYDTEIISSIINDAKKIVSEDRKKYNKLMKVIEKFIAENDIIVREVTEYFFNLYTMDMFNLPLKLTNLLYDSDPILAKYVSLDIKIYKYHSRISIDGIQFVHFTYINSEIRQNIINYTCIGIYTSVKYKCFGPEITLINLYADLVHPGQRKNWYNLLLTEKTLADEITESLTERIIGGRGNSYKIGLVGQMIAKYYGNALKCHLSYKSNASIINNLEYYSAKKEHTFDFNIKLKIIKNFINDSHVVVGQLGIDSYNNTLNKSVRLQIVTSNTLNEEIKNIKQILGVSITYNIYNVKIPTNLNLHKLSVFYEREHLIDIYDAGNYEVIPYNVIDINNIKECNIGTPFVIMRFRLVDIWYTLYNIKVGSLPKNVGLPIVHKLIDNYIAIRNKMLNMPIENIFSLNYIGHIEDINLNKLRIADRLKIKYIPSYLPGLK